MKPLLHLTIILAAVLTSCARHRNPTDSTYYVHFPAVTVPVNIVYRDRVVLTERHLPEVVTKVTRHPGGPVTYQDFTEK